MGDNTFFHKITYCGIYIVFLSSINLLTFPYTSSSDLVTDIVGFSTICLNMSASASISSFPNCVFFPSLVLHSILTYILIFLKLQSLNIACIMAVVGSIFKLMVGSNLSLFQLAIFTPYSNAVIFRYREPESN